MDLDIAFAQQLDAEDQLGPFRGEFFNSNENVVYLDGNSLGRLPLRTIALLEDQIKQKWGSRLIRSWNESWMDLPAHLSKKLAPLVGASSDEILFGDSTSVNLYKLAQAAMQIQAPRNEIISDSLNFPSDLYILQGICKNPPGSGKLLLAESEDDVHASVEHIKGLLSPQTAILSLSLVAFKSAYLYPMKELTKAAHAVGAVVIWDLSHAAGAVEIDLSEANVDMAVGCSYKYLNGGPGAPAFLYVRKDLQQELDPAIQGWFGDHNPFDFDLEYHTAEGIKRFNIGTPTVLSLAAIEPGLDLLASAGMASLRKKSLALQQYLLDLIQARLSDLGFSLGSPENADQRGSHIALRHAEAGRICQALINPPPGKSTVIPDFRAPHTIRFGIAPLYVTYEDIWISVQRLVEIMEELEYQKFPGRPIGVT